MEINFLKEWKKGQITLFHHDFHPFFNVSPKLSIVIIYPTIEQNCMASTPLSKLGLN